MFLQIIFILVQVFQEKLINNKRRVFNYICLFYITITSKGNYKMKKDKQDKNKLDDHKRYIIISNLATIKDEIRNNNLMNASISESFENIENTILQ